MFMKWLVAISKDRNLAHVIITSSDSFTMDTLENVIDISVVKRMLLHDLSEEDQ